MYLVGGKVVQNVIRLSDRDRDVLIALAKTAGTDAQVADELGLQHNSIKIYIMRIRKKLTAQGYDVKSRYNLITFAKEHLKELEGE